MLKLQMILSVNKGVFIMTLPVIFLMTIPLANKRVCLMNTLMMKMNDIYL